MSHNVEREPQEVSRFWDLLSLSHSHILVEGGPGFPKRARPSLLEYGLGDDSSRTGHQPAGIPCHCVASLLAALTTEWQGVIGEAECEGLYSVSSCSVHWAVGLTARINR